MLLFVLFLPLVLQKYLGAYRGSLYGVRTLVTISSARHAFVELDGGLIGHVQGRADLLVEFNEREMTEPSEVKLDQELEEFLKRRFIKITDVGLDPPDSIRVGIKLPLFGQQHLRLARVT